MIMDEKSSLEMNYPAASRRGINYGHSRGLLVGNPETRGLYISGYRLRGYDKRGKPRGISSEKKE